MSKFPYISDLDTEKFRFYRLPKVLIKDPEFDGISADAKLLYGLLLDRTSLSIKNRWFDKDEKVYIIYPLKDLAKELNFSKKKVGKLLAELDDKHGIGLITRIRRGLGNPDRIYVRWCVSPEMAERRLQKLQNDESGEVNLPHQEPPNIHSNETDFSETDHIDIDYIDSTQAEPADEIGQIDYIKYFNAKLKADDLRADMPTRQERINEIINLLADICSTRKKWIRIYGEERDASQVRARMMSLTGDHIRYVLDCVDRRAKKAEPLENIRGYLIACLYNATTSMDSYYTLKAIEALNSKH